MKQVQQQNSLYSFVFDAPAYLFRPEAKPRNLAKLQTGSLCHCVPTFAALHEVCSVRSSQDVTLCSKRAFIANYDNMNKRPKYTYVSVMLRAV
jgi:hypothetical protein